MDHNPTTPAELERWVKVEWANIDQETINHTIEHVRHIMPEIINKGGEFVD